LQITLNIILFVGISFFILFNVLLPLDTNNHNAVLAKTFRESLPPRATTNVTKTPPSLPNVPNEISIVHGAYARGAELVYDPKMATVTNGTNMTWLNNDIVAHTATARDGSFDTGIISMGASKSALVSGQGTVPYFCTIHPWMEASLQVTSQNQSTTSTTPSVAQGIAQSNVTVNNQTQGRQQQQQIPALFQDLEKLRLQQDQQQKGPFTEYYKSIKEPRPELEVTTNFEGKSPLNSSKTLPSKSSTALGTEVEHNNNWITANHDLYGTRASNQSIIGKDNVSQLQVKWIYTNNFPIEAPPLIVGNTAFVQDAGNQIIALNMSNGSTLWRADTGAGGLNHGITYDDGVLYGGTGSNSTIVAVNSTSGEVLWESPRLGPPELGYTIPVIPLVWHDYVIAGSAGGDLPPQPGVVQGNITALNRTNGEIIWNLRTTAGEWVSPENVPPNGGGTVWSGMSFDPETGILYAPVGNATPDFNATSRLTPNYYTNTVMAVNITNGKMLWATPFIEHGTVLDVDLPDTHDGDVAFGTSVTKVTFDNGTEKKVVIGHDKMGNIIAMDPATGDELWWNTIGTVYRYYAIPMPPPEGSGEVWPNTQGGVEAFHAVDNDTLYVSTSSSAGNYFTQGTSGYVNPVFEAMKNGVGNGTITALDMKTGDIKWQYPSELPTWVSPLVTNGIVFSGHITHFGSPYPVNEFGAATDTPIQPSGIILALDKDTGKKL
jgi:alcohol dehydrogenase (cytochrome c)